MKLLRHFSLVLFAFVTACADATAPGVGPLEGTWAAAPEAGSPSGRYERLLTFRNDGTFTSEVRSYGIYPGQPRDQLSGYFRTEGTYGVEIEGNGMVFHAARVVSWDRFYGANSPEVVRDAFPGETIYDDARYEVQGPLLTLRFTIYPADAPEPAVLVFTRAD